MAAYAATFYCYSFRHCHAMPCERMIRLASSTVLSVTYPILWYFILYSFLGWCLEVAFCSINTGKFVNRGFLNGPVCPIYGFGAVSVVLLLRPISDQFILLYVGSVIVCSAIELVVGFMLKKLFKTTWWDYSDQRFNLGGYICLKFSLLWGVACLFLVKVIHPTISGLVHLLPVTLGWILLAIVYLTMLSDLVFSIIAVRKLTRDLGRIAEIAAKLHEQSDAMAKSIGNTAISVASKIESMDLDTKKRELEVKLEENKAKFSELLSVNEKRIEDMLGKNKAKYDRLLRAFPNMKSLRFSDALTQLKQYRKIGNNTNPTVEKKEDTAE